MPKPTTKQLIVELAKRTNTDPNKIAKVLKEEKTQEPFFDAQQKCIEIRQELGEPDNSPYLKAYAGEMCSYWSRIRDRP